MMTHGQCQCVECGTPYDMGDIDNMNPSPKNMMKSPNAARFVWRKTAANIFDAPGEIWEEAYSEAG